MRDCFSLAVSGDEEARAYVAALAEALGVAADTGSWPAARCPGDHGFIAFYHADKKVLEFYFPGRVPWSVLKRVFPEAAVRG